MRFSWQGVAGVGASIGAAVFWAIGLAVLQGPTEPIGSGASAENNTYWVRDLRFMAIIAVVLGLVLALRGRRAAGKVGVGVCVLWIAADVALDRLDVAGAPAATALAVVGCGAVVTVVLLFTRAGGRGDRRVEGRDRRTLIVVAAVGAALTPLAAGIESPTDAESALTASALALGTVLIVTTVGAALAAAPAGTTGRWIGAGTLAALGGATLVTVRLIEPPGQLIPMLLLGTVLLGGASLLSLEWTASWPMWRRQLPMLLVLLIGYPFLVIFWLLLTVFGVPVAAWFTALAGSVPVNAADSDTLYALIGLATGLVIGPLLALVMVTVTAAPLPRTAGTS